MSELSHTFSSLLFGMPALLKGGVPGERAGIQRLASHRLRVEALPRIDISSSSFADGDFLPRDFTADGESSSPPLLFGVVPDGTRSLVLLVEDPDAPTPRPFVHWLLYDIRPEVKSLAAHLPPQGVDFAVQGRNSMFKRGYSGAAPPKGDLAHHYHFQLFALDRPTGLSSGAGRARVLSRMRGHAIGFGELVALYKR